MFKQIMPPFEVTLKDGSAMKPVATLENALGKRIHWGVRWRHGSYSYALFEEIEDSLIKGGPVVVLCQLTPHIPEEALDVLRLLPRLSPDEKLYIVELPDEEFQIWTSRELLLAETHAKVNDGFEGFNVIHVIDADSANHFVLFKAYGDPTRWVESTMTHIYKAECFKAVMYVNRPLLKLELFELNHCQSFQHKSTKKKKNAK